MTALVIFLGTYIVLAIGGLPGFRVDRTGAAIIGASLMIGFSVKSVLRGTSLFGGFAPVELNHLQKTNILTIDELP